MMGRGIRWVADVVLGLGAVSRRYRGSLYLGGVFCRLCLGWLRRLCLDGCCARLVWGRVFGLELAGLCRWLR